MLERNAVHKRCNVLIVGMDYVLDAIDMGERGFAVLLTKWLNLGAAETL